MRRLLTLVKLKEMLFSRRSVLIAKYEVNTCDLLLACIENTLACVDLAILSFLLLSILLLEVYIIHVIDSLLDYIHSDEVVNW